MRWKRNRARRYIYIFNLILFTIPFTDIHSLVRPLWKLISHHAANNLSIFSRWKITTWYSTIISKFYSFHECAVTFLQIYIYIYTEHHASSCLHFFLSGKFDPILVKSVFASATNSKAFSKHDKKYVQVWNERKNKKVRP